MLDADRRRSLLSCRVIAAPYSWDFVRGPAATQALLEVAEQEGIGASACLAGTQLSRDDLHDPQLELQAEQELTVIRNLLHRTRRSAGLGVRAGSRATVGMLGIWGFAMYSSRTTRDVIDIAHRYGFGKFSWVFLRPWIDEQGPETHIVYDDSDVPGDVRDFLTERDLTFSAVLMPQFFGRVLPMRITTTLGSASADAFADALPGCQITVRAQRNAQILDSAILDAPLPHADPYALQVCEHQCEQLLASRSYRAGLAAAVRASLLRRPPENHSLADIARERHVDPRTLRRHLASEGTSFRELIDEVHETLASELLRTGALTVEEVARRLGYADASSFTRAYKRWTGQSPGVTARMGYASTRPLSETVM
jgi:AraC-like DNA-binding protein